MPDAITTTMLRQAVKEDEVLSKVLKDVENCKKSSDTKKRQYDGIFEELTVEDGVLLKGERLVITPSLQAQLIQLSHEGHGQGETRTISLLRERV